MARQNDNRSTRETTRSRPRTAARGERPRESRVSPRSTAPAWGSPNRARRDEREVVEGAPRREALLESGAEGETPGEAADYARPLRSGSGSRRRERFASGISNRPLPEERQRQATLPARGSRKTGNSRSRRSSGGEDRGKAVRSASA